MAEDSSTTLIRNARVITCDPAFSIADAIAISGEKIAAVGRAETLAADYPEARVIDAGGRAVMPGMIDSHSHMDREGLKTVFPTLSGCASIDDILQRIAALAAEKEPGEWIVTMPIGEPPYYWNVPDCLAEKRFPTRHELDRVAPDNPVYIRPIWGYWRHILPLTSIANTRALEAAGLKPGMNGLPETIVFEEEGGQLTGVIHEHTYMPVVELAFFDRMPRFRHEDRVAGIRKSMAIHNAHGTTSVLEEHGCAQELIDAWRAVTASGESTLRANLIYSPSWHFANVDGYAKALKEWSGWLGHGGTGDAWLRVEGMFADYGITPENALRARAAPYTGWSGFNYDSGIPRENMDAVLTEAARNDIRVAAIWMEFLDHFRAVNEKVPLNGRRWIMGHLDVANEDQIRTIAELGLVMSSHTNRYVYKHGHNVRNRIGVENENDICPLRRIRDAGIHIGLATDNVPTTLWYPVWQAVTRYNMVIDAPVAPDQALTREEALACATIEGAWLTCEEDIKGSLEPGKLADLLILSDDPLTCPENDIKDITAEVTFVGGRIVHDTGKVTTGNA